MRHPGVAARFHAKVRKWCVQVSCKGSNSDSAGPDRAKEHSKTCCGAAEDKHASTHVRHGGGPVLRDKQRISGEVYALHLDEREPQFLACVVTCDV